MIVNLTNKKYEVILINQITNIGETSIALHKKYIPSPKKPLLTNPP